MIDQSHNIEGKVDAMIQSVMNIQTAYAKALLVDEAAVAAAQARGRRARGAPAARSRPSRPTSDRSSPSFARRAGRRGRPRRRLPQRRAIAERLAAERGTATSSERVRAGLSAGAPLRIALFVTCIGDTISPEVPKAVVRLLERLGHEVVFPAEQTCCGQLHANSGYRGEALALARRFVDVFDAVRGRRLAVLVVCRDGARAVSGARS